MQRRCQADPVSLPSGRLEKTTRSSPHHVAQHRPTGSETTPPYAARSSRFGSEPPSVEDDVDVSWRYAIRSCMPETMTTTYIWCTKCCPSWMFFYRIVSVIMACHILYGRPYCNDAPEGVGGITTPKLNRGGWNSARTKHFEGNVVCKNWGAIGSGAAEGRRKTSLGDPKKLDFFSVHTTTHDLTHFPSADFHEIFARTRGSVSAKSFRSPILIFFSLRGRLPPKTDKNGVFLGTLTRRGLQPRGYILGRLGSFSQLAEMPGMCLLLLRFYAGRTVWELGSVKVAHFLEMTHVFQVWLRQHAAAYSG